MVRGVKVREKKSLRRHCQHQVVQCLDLYCRIHENCSSGYQNLTVTVLIGKPFIYVSGHPQIVRSCFFGEITNTQGGCSADPSLPFVKQISCDVCSGDLCNGSSTMAPIALTILAFFALARIFS